MQHSKCQEIENGELVLCQLVGGSLQRAIEIWDKLPEYEKPSIWGKAAWMKATLPPERRRLVAEFLRVTRGMSWESIRGI